MTRHPIGSLSLAALLLLSLHGCTHDLLQVTDPDIIPDVNTPSGALALKNGVILRLEQVTAGLGGNGPDNLFIYGGLLADEWRSGDTFVQRNDMDQRLFDPTNTFLAGPLRALNRVRVESRTAIDKLRAYTPTPVSNIGLMFALTAFVDNLAGEYYCNGIPLSFPNPDGTFSYGDPVSDDSMFALAVATADSALANRAGSDSIRVRQLASIVKARALVNRGRFAAAAAAVADDATTWLTKLNQLRGDAALLPTPVDTSYRPVRGTTLASLADPVLDTARVSLLFSERAFWMFSTGHRLGDLRRLVRQYARPIESVYPTGSYVKGGLYGTAVSLPIPLDEQNNPQFKQCTDRNP